MPAERDVRTRVSYDHESGRRRPVADWGVGEDAFDRLPSRRFTGADRRAERRDEGGGDRREERRDEDGGDRRPVESWFEPEGAGESRTIVIETSEPVPEEPSLRRTVVIRGHPDRLPATRTSRPSRTAIDRIGASPDRIVAYAVALGFLLILIAALTTGQ